MRRMGDHRFRHMAHALCLTACLLVAAHPSALAGEAGEARKGTKKRSVGTAFQTSKKDPIFITSDRMEVDQKKNTITYSGRVVTLQGKMTMRSEVLTAYYNPDMKQLKKVVAKGKVHVTQGDRVATGRKAVFDGRAQTITLTGNPVVRQGNSQVSGSRITFYIAQDRAVVEGGTRQRVKATIFPEDLVRQEKGKARPGKER
ncbi:MAG: lipopolysaccharide transport periplasmic protein LptA [Candidatus Binatia bacterium]